MSKMAVRMLKLSRLSDDAANHPSPGLTIAIAQSKPSLTLLPPAFFLFTLSPDEFWPNVEFFANEPIIFDIASTSCLGGVGGVVFEIRDVLKHIVLIV